MKKNQIFGQIQLELFLFQCFHYNQIYVQFKKASFQCIHHHHQSLVTQLYFWVGYVNYVSSFQCIQFHKINGQIQVDRPKGTLVESMLMLILIYEVTEDRDVDSISFLSLT